MGYEDRDYYQESFKGGYQDSYSRQSLAQFDSRSMVMKLIIINVIIFAIDTFTPIIPKTGGNQWLSYWMSLKVSELWQAWAFLTHGFAHASFGEERGLMHVLFNMFTLFVFGYTVEQRLGKSEFLRFYIAAILISGVGWLLFDKFVEGNQFSRLVGASGAVSAVIAYFIFYAPKATLYMLGIFPMPAWAVGVLFMVINIMYALNSESSVAWEAHLVGFGFGVLYYRLGWNFSRFDFGLENLLKRRPNLKIHDPEAAEQKLREDADRILGKINEHGEESLTRKERRTLKKYSESVRRHRNNES